MTTRDPARTPDGRRGGPIPVGEPANEDRDQVADLARQAAERRQREREDLEAAAEPAGVPPSDDQRQAIDALRDKSAELRAPAARALRRQPVAVGTVYDDERADVEDLHADARDARLAALAERGIVDPTVENESAGFDPDLPGLPGHELYGVFTCPNCGNQVERAFPGYVDWDLASRDLVCSQCGGLVKRGGAAGQQDPAELAEPSETAQHGAEAYATQQASGQIQPPGVQTSAQPVQTSGEQLPTGEPGTSNPPPLSADERAELEQLRAERAQREQHQVEQQPPPDQAPPQEQPPSG